MEVTIFQRIKLILEDKQVSVNSLSKLVDVAQTTLNTQLRGERALSANVVAKVLIAFPDVSAEWLLRGKGEMLISEQTTLAKMQDAKGRESDVVEHDSVWKAKYEELEKRYDQLLSILGGGMRQANVG